MNKDAIQQFLEALVRATDEGNDACADEDRGRDNRALCLVVYDDGSGIFCTAQQGYHWDRQTIDKHALYINRIGEFDSEAEGAELLEQWLR